MSSTVDNRVVDMGFNNQQFEKGVQESTTSIEKLKKSLDFTGAEKGLTGLNNIGKGISFDGISEGVQSLTSRFSSLGIVGITILQNLTNAAIEFGKKLVNNFLQPAKAGFSEYETQMNAIQTVLANTASKGTTLSQVSDALDELNTYADKTIYNFTEMTKNIGTFTAAGVDLETSTQAIKGIANLAAVSGSNSQQAATAMYQLSQALSSGTVKLMDWNSVVNAGMGGQVFQDALKETARLHKVSIDDMIAKEGSFRNTLQEGWLTSEILLDTLKKFTGDLTEEQLISMGYTEEQIEGIIKLGQTANDAATKVKTFTQLKDTLNESLQSGWTKTWQLVIGDFEEAKALFTEISDTLGAAINASSDARNAIVEEWRSFGGRELAIDTLRKGLEAFIKISTPIKEAWKSIFPGEHLGLTLATLTDHIHDFVAALRISDETAGKVKRIFAGLFAAIAIGRDVVVGIITPLKELLSKVKIDGTGVLDFLANFADKIVEFQKTGNIAEVVSKAVTTAIEKIKEFWEKTTNGLELIKRKIGIFVQEVRDWFINLFSKMDFKPMGDFFTKVETRFEPFTLILKAVGSLLKAMLKGAGKLLPFLLKLGSALGEFLGNLGTWIYEGLKNIDFVKVFDQINTGLIGALLLALRGFLKSGSGVMEQVGSVFGGITGILDGVRGSLEAFQQNLKAKTLMTIAIAIGILAISLIAISMIDSAKLTMALGVITALFVDLIGSMAAFNAAGGGGVKSSIALIALSASLLIMAAALTKLAAIDAEAMERGLGAIYALSITMVAFSKIVGGANAANIAKSAIALSIYSIAILLLAESVKKLGALDPVSITNGLIAVGVLLGEVAIFMRLLGDGKTSMTAGIAMIGMAAAILIMAGAVERFGNMDIAVLQQGLVTLGIIFAEIAAFTQLVGDGKRIIATSIGMAIISGTLLILVEVLKKMGELSWETLGKGLLGMGAALLIIAASVRAMPGNMILQSVALIAIAGALAILANTIEKMGGMSWEELGRGLAGLAAALLIISIALYAMAGTVAGSLALIVAAGALFVLANVMTTLGAMSLGEIGLALLALAGIFVVLGLAGLILTPLAPTLLALGGAMLLIGLGAALVGIGLLAFSVGLSALAASGMAAAVVIVGMVTTLLGLVPVIINTLIDAIIIFAEGIIRATPTVAQAITTLLLAVLQIIIDVTPTLLEALNVLLLGLIQLIVDVVPPFIKAVLLLLVTLLQEIALKLPDFLQAGFDILIAFLQGIRDNIAEVVTTVTEIIVEFLGAVSDNLPDVIQSGWDLVIAFINGMADSVDKNTQPLIDAVGRLATSMIDGLVGGITSGASKVINSLTDIAKDALEAAKEWLLAFSPSKRFALLGKDIVDGLVKGINNFADKAPDAITGVSKNVVKAMSSVIGDIQDSLDSEIDLDPKIRPVIDMSEIVAGGKLLDNLLNDKTLSLVAEAANLSNRTNAIVKTDQYGNPIDSGKNIEFNQYNYSPKALSRIEIYRQTRNQLRSAKGLVQ